jgi:hypothetical protein
MWRVCTTVHDCWNKNLLMLRQILSTRGHMSNLTRNFTAHVSHGTSTLLCSVILSSRRAGYVYRVRAVSVTKGNLTLLERAVCFQKHCVFRHYPSFCLYLKTVLFIGRYSSLADCRPLSFFLFIYSSFRNNVWRLDSLSVFR